VGIRGGKGPGFDDSIPNGFAAVGATLAVSHRRAAGVRGTNGAVALGGDKPRPYTNKIWILA
ncbi:MAG: hypothetical protein Q8M58_11170, partial [Anaerolineales bacterium]|nr:hypothetical protein [Anaerolineales bacterium]